ncbi:uncharacterized protein LOC117894271 isoform X2 [Drosophila subobscura]|uniref:uncharacterized protein LOC117894271 isoform X2 n=1 Tax=Drosophila subobscura TaxID=7241 RepID=UPI00155AC45C|nr:uncharacterized protein LOC117894271 isoform X2 [Drosophila subobscura]
MKSQNKSAGVLKIHKNASIASSQTATQDIGKDSYQRHVSQFVVDVKRCSETVRKLEPFLCS